jgi:hypothetical protein
LSAKGAHGAEWTAPALCSFTVRTLRPDIEELWREIASSENRPPMFDDRRYGALPDRKVVKAFLEYIAVPISPAAYKPHDVMLFQFNQSATYAAVLTNVQGVPHVISAVFTAKTVAERTLTRSLRARLKAVYQLREIID